MFLFSFISSVREYRTAGPIVACVPIETSILPARGYFTTSVKRARLMTSFLLSYFHPAKEERLPQQGRMVLDAFRRECPDCVAEALQTVTAGNRF